MYFFFGMARYIHHQNLHYAAPSLALSNEFSLIHLQALIEMVDWKDADIMVKYYHSNPLKINGKSVKVYLSLKRLR